jgi:hypothetical protein
MTEKDGFATLEQGGSGGLLNIILSHQQKWNEGKQ